MKDSRKLENIPFLVNSVDYKDVSERYSYRPLGMPLTCYLLLRLNFGTRGFFRLDYILEGRGLSNSPDELECCYENFKIDVAIGILRINCRRGLRVRRADVLKNIGA